MLIMEVLKSRPVDFRNLEKEFKSQGFELIGVKFIDGETLFYQVKKIED